MRHACLACLTLVLVLGLGPVLNADCVKDCFHIKKMLGFQGDDPYCWEFEFITGRIVWSSDGDAFLGTPVSAECPDMENEQTVDKYTPSSCFLLCPSSGFPQEHHTEGTKIGELGFGCYECNGI